MIGIFLSRRNSFLLHVGLTRFFGMKFCVNKCKKLTNAGRICAEIITFAT